MSNHLAKTIEIVADRDFKEAARILWDLLPYIHVLGVYGNTSHVEMSVPCELIDRLCALGAELEDVEEADAPGTDAVY
jgi:hypothetical protein